MPVVSIRVADSLIFFYHLVKNICYNYAAWKIKVLARRMEINGN